MRTVSEESEIRRTSLYPVGKKAVLKVLCLS